MTLALINRDPLPAATNVAPTMRPRFTIFSPAAPVDQTTINVWVAGRRVVVAGQGAGAQVMGSGVGGFEIVVDGLGRLEDGDIIDMRVRADDVLGSAPLDASWQFTTADARAPALAEADPAPGAHVAISPATVALRLTNNPSLSVEDFTTVLSSDPITLLNFITLPDTEPGSLATCAGRMFEVTAGTDTGERRAITVVHGPHLAEYAGTAVDGTQIMVLRDWGLDVYVGGQPIVRCGQLFDETWVGSTVSVDVQGDVLVSLVPPGPLSTVVNIGIRAHNGRQSADFGYEFTIGDPRGPRISNITPANGTRGLALDTIVSFDIVDAAEGVDDTTINIDVNGTPIIVGGSVLPGDFSGSSIVAGTVTIVKTTDYVDGQMYFFDVRASDNAPSPHAGERRVLRLHFGALIGVLDAVTGLGGTDVVRALAFDLTGTSFAEPIRLKHTGYAWDGYWYDDGGRARTRASWATELGTFPLAGVLIVTAANGWAILVHGDDGPWMTCVPRTAPEWSMAGNGGTLDAVFGPQAAFMICGLADVIVVDFVNDRAERFSTVGRSLGAKTIAQRAEAQTLVSTDSNYALPSGPFSHMAGIIDVHARVFALAHASRLTLVTILDASWSAILAPVPVVTRQLVEWTAADWRRLAIVATDGGPLTLLPLILAYNDAGQGQIEVWNWNTFAHDGDRELFLDDSTTPALAAAEAHEIDVLWPLVAVCLDGYVDIVDALTPAVDEYAQATIGVTGTLAAVALDKKFERGRGHFYVAADDVVSFLLPAATTTVLSTGLAATMLAAVGGADGDAQTFVRTRMHVVAGP
jgi:hypothetical protein